MYIVDIFLTAVDVLNVAVVNNVGLTVIFSSHVINYGYLILPQIRPYASSIRPKAVVSSVSLDTSRMSAPALQDGSWSRKRNVCLLVRNVHFF